MATESCTTPKRIATNGITSLSDPSRNSGSQRCVRSHRPASPSSSRQVTRRCRNLPGIQLAQAAAPPSKPDGDPFDVVFTNQRAAPVKLFWLDRQGKRKPYGTLEAGWRKPQQTRPGAVWLVTDADDQPLGHFVVGDRTALAVVPAK